MAPSKGKKAGFVKEEMIMEELVIQEVLAELIDTTHLPTQQESFMHLKIP
jgi:hypothetical protein